MMKQVGISSTCFHFDEEENESTYDAVKKKADAVLVKASCDFALLKSAMLKYCQIHNY